LKLLLLFFGAGKFDKVLFSSGIVLLSVFTGSLILG